MLWTSFTNATGRARLRPSLAHDSWCHSAAQPVLIFARLLHGAACYSAAWLLLQASLSLQRRLAELVSFNNRLESSFDGINLPHQRWINVVVMMVSWPTSFWQCYRHALSASIAYISHKLHAVLLLFLSPSAQSRRQENIQNYGCNGNLLSDHGIVERSRISSMERHGKSLEKECCLPGVFCDGGETPVILLCELNGHLMTCTSYLYGKMGRRCVC